MPLQRGAIPQKALDVASDNGSLWLASTAERESSNINKEGTWDTHSRHDKNNLEKQVSNFYFLS